MISIKDMVKSGAITEKASKKFIEAAEKREGILIFGQTYVGKTTLAKCIAKISNAVIYDDIFSPKKAIKFLELINNNYPAIGIVGACGLKEAKKRLCLLAYLETRSMPNVNNIKHFIFLFRDPSGKRRTVYYKG